MSADDHKSLLAAKLLEIFIQCAENASKGVSSSASMSGLGALVSPEHVDQTAWTTFKDDMAKVVPMSNNYNFLLTPEVALTGILPHSALFVAAVVSASITQYDRDAVPHQIQVETDATGVTVVTVTYHHSVAEAV